MLVSVCLSVCLCVCLCVCHKSDTFWIWVRWGFWRIGESRAKPREEPRANSTGQRHGPTARANGTGKRHGQMARANGTGKQHGQTARANGTGKQHGQTARANSTGKQHGQTAWANGMGKRHGQMAWAKTRLHTVYTLYKHCIQKTIIDDGRLAQRAKKGLQHGCTKKPKKKGQRPSVLGRRPTSSSMQWLEFKGA